MIYIQSWLDVYSGAVQDVATNLNLNNFGITVTETADTTNPFFISGVIDYNNGILVINASETIDTTPRSYVNLADFYLTKNTRLRKQVAIMLTMDMFNLLDQLFYQTIQYWDIHPIK